MNNTYQVVTLKEKPELKEVINQLHSTGWVKFMREDPVAIRYWDDLLDWFPEFQFVLLNSSGSPMACGNSIPFCWNDTPDNLPSGWDGVFEQGIADYKIGVESNSLSALAIVVHPEFRGKGLSEILVREMKSLAKKRHIQNMIAPVRPFLKSKYPLIPMDEYIHWKRSNGEAFDPWIRTHLSTGASITKVAEKSMTIPGTITQWGSWTNMEFPATGKYLIPDGLVPLEVNRDKDTGVYVEPNVWITHHLN